MVFLLKNKLIGSKEFQRVPAAPTLNKRCPQDPNKNGNYNVFVMEMRMPKELEHFLSCSVAVITRPCVTHVCFFSPFLCKKQNIWFPNSFNWAANKMKFTGIIKFCQLTSDGWNKALISQSAALVYQCDLIFLGFCWNNLLVLMPISKEGAEKKLNNSYHISS